MKVILISNLRNLGKIGDVIETKDGYARNYLIPKGFAIYFSDANYESFKTQKDTIEAQNKKNKDLALANKKNIATKEIVILENAGDDGKLYGSVSSVRLAKIINDLIKSKDVKKSNVVIGETIKNVGKYRISLELHPEVSFTKEIIIARTKEEAEKIKSGAWEKELKEKEEAERKTEVNIGIRKEAEEEKVEETKEEAKEETK